jgi:ABC-type Zn uptake system ZnuABC Zn-binding protein ZnuA
MINDIVQNVGGERVEVTGLMGPGVEPHLYKASEGDVSRMAEAERLATSRGEASARANHRLRSN